MAFGRTALVILAAALGSGCSASKPAPKPAATVVWRPAGSWSGHGNTQTESFLIESVQWRIKWETSNEKPPGAGRFQVIVDSAVSGRQIAVAVDHQGAGSDIAYISEDPHLFYLVIQSSHVDWSVKVEEAVVRPAAPSPAGGTQR